MTKRPTLKWFIRREVGPFRRYWGTLLPGSGSQWTNQRRVAHRFATQEEAETFARQSGCTNFVLVQEAE